MSNKTYDILKAIALVVLPALATLVIAVFEIWGLPYGAQIGATITAVATFLGAILTVSNAKYKVEKKEDEELERAMLEGQIYAELAEKREEDSGK